MSEISNRKFVKTVDFDCGRFEESVTDLFYGVLGAVASKSFIRPP